MQDKHGTKMSNTPRKDRLACADRIAGDYCLDSSALGLPELKCLLLIFF